jgi:hypothetical protein
VLISYGSITNASTAVLLQIQLALFQLLQPINAYVLKDIFGVLLPVHHVQKPTKPNAEPYHAIIIFGMGRIAILAYQSAEQWHIHIHMLTIQYACAVKVLGVPLPSIAMVAVPLSSKATVELIASITFGMEQIA